MQRRDFLALSAVLASMPLSLSAASNGLPYSLGLVTRSLAAAEPVFLDFKASWCTTCRSQEKVISAFKSQNLHYEKHITFIDVDWDFFGWSNLVSQLKNPSPLYLGGAERQQKAGAHPGWYAAQRHQISLG